MRGNSGGVGIGLRSKGGEVDARCSRDPLDGPGSEVGTIPMSSRSLPARSVGDLEGEGFVGERREFFRPGRRLGTSIASRGRFGVEPRERSVANRAASVFAVASHVWRGALDDEEEDEAGSVMRGSCGGTGACWGGTLQSSLSALRFLWFSGQRSSIGGFGKRRNGKAGVYKGADSNTWQGGTKTRRVVHHHFLP